MGIGQKGRGEIGKGTCINGSTTRVKSRWVGGNNPTKYRTSVGEIPQILLFPHDAVSVSVRRDEGRRLAALSWPTSRFCEQMGPAESACFPDLN